MFEKKTGKSEYEYTPDWDITGYEDEEKFPKEKRKTKAEILAEIEAEKQSRAGRAPNLSDDSGPDHDEGESDFDSEQSRMFPHFSPIASNPYDRVYEQADRFDHLSEGEDDEGKESDIKRKFSLFGKKKGKKKISERISEEDQPEQQANPYEEPYEEIDFDEPHFHIPGFVWILLGGILSIFALGFIGYYNTDFSSSGQTYLVPLEVRYERQYVQKTDELLNYLLDMDKTLESDLTSLDSNYVSASNRLSQQKQELAALTNSLSRYTGIPTKFESYQKLLLNHSISLQNFIDTALERSQKSGYQEYLLNALVDYEESFEDVKQGRLEIEDEIFRNMSDSKDISQEQEQGGEDAN